MGVSVLTVSRAQFDATHMSMNLIPAAFAWIFSSSVIHLISAMISVDALTWLVHPLRTGRVEARLGPLSRWRRSRAHLGR